MIVAMAAMLVVQAAPAGRWEVNIAPAQCTLRRRLDATPVERVTIITTPGSGAFGLLVEGKALHDRREAAGVRGRITIGSGAATPWPAALLRPGTGAAVLYAGLRDEIIDAIAAGGPVAIEAGGVVAGPIALPDAAKGIAALRTCEREQLAEWGADAAAVTPARALTDPDGWLKVGQLRAFDFAGDRLDALFRLGIAADGTVDGCEQLSGERVGACPMLTGRRLYAPARDAAGKAVQGAATYRIELFTHRR